MRYLALALGLIGLLHPSAARAEDYQFSRVALFRTGCATAGLGDPELRAATAFELSASSLSLAPAQEPAAASDVVVNVRLPCAPLADLGLSASFAGIVFERAITLDELPRASRARALALVLAELLAEFATPELAEEEDVHPVPAVNSEARGEVTAQESGKKRERNVTAPKPAATVAGHRDEIDDGVAHSNGAGRTSLQALPRLGAGPELRVFFSGSSLFGGRVHGDWDPVTIGVSVLARNSTVSAGVLSAFIAQGSAAVRVLTLGHSDHASLSMGPRVGLGYVTVTAQSLTSDVQAHAAREPYVDAAAFADFGFHPLPRVRFGVAAELGYARGVVALFDTTDVGHYGGLFSSALFNVSFEL